MDQKNLLVAQCYESETNPRGTNFEDASFKELVASIKEKGVIQPVLARPRKKGSKAFEIVAGNRRLRASIQAGLTEIPALVKEMTDLEVREAQIIENLQRADIHPLEEGAAYRALIEAGKFDVKAVAAHVGKSESYVRDRLLLTGLTLAAQKAFRAGEITAGHASLIGRLDAKLQKKALDFCRWGDTEVADLREWIRDESFGDPANAPWKNDEAMQAALGGCDECNGKGGDLFGKKAAEACTNPQCYPRRMNAYIAIKLKENPALLLLSKEYGDPTVKGAIRRNGYIELPKGKCDFVQDGIVVEGEGLGRMLRVCASVDCKTHYSGKSGQYYRKTPEEVKKEKDARRKEREAQEKKRIQSNIEINTALSKLTWPLSEKHLDLMLDLMVDHYGFMYQQPIAKRNGVEATKKKVGSYTTRDLETPLVDHFKKLGKLGKLRLIFEFGLEGARRDNAYIKRF